MYRKNPVESASSISLIFEFTDANRCAASVGVQDDGGTDDVECDRVRFCGTVRVPAANDVDIAVDCECRREWCAAG